MPQVHPDAAYLCPNSQAKAEFDPEAQRHWAPNPAKPLPLCFDWNLPMCLHQALPLCVLHWSHSRWLTVAQAIHRNRYLPQIRRLVQIPHAMYITIHTCHNEYIVIQKWKNYCWSSTSAWVIFLALGTHFIHVSGIYTRHSTEAQYNGHL